MAVPDIQPVFIESPLATPELASRLPGDHCYTISPSVVRPASRGSVQLVSSDPELRVHGIAGLRIADASIMPNVTSGNTNAPTFMIGEKLIEIIRSHV
jgi:hypothetical protein